MAISGAIAGLGGASQDGDFRHTLDADPNGLQRQNYGYSGIVVAALARYNPLTGPLMPFLITAHQNASNSLQGPDFPSLRQCIMQWAIHFWRMCGSPPVRN